MENIAYEDLTKLSRLEIADYVSDYLFREYGISDIPLKHLIGILAIEIETYGICQKEIEKNGIVIFHNGGKTQGANPHIAILHRTTRNIMRIMKELGMTPKSRLSIKPISRPSNPAVINFLKGIKTD